MSKVERTSAGLQIIIPGCERRTLPKSTTPVDESGQGLLHFYRPPLCGRALKPARTRLCGPPRGKKHYRKAVYFLLNQQQVRRRSPIGGQGHRCTADQHDCIPRMDALFLDL